MLFWDIKSHREEETAKKTRIRKATAVRDIPFIDEQCRLSWSMSGLLAAFQPNSSFINNDHNSEYKKSDRDNRHDAFSRARYTQTGHVYTYSDFRPACDQVTCVRASRGTPSTISPPMYVVCGDANGYVYLFAYPCTFAGNYGWRCDGHVGGVCAVVVDSGGACVCFRVCVCMYTWSLCVFYYGWRCDEHVGGVCAVVVDTGGACVCVCVCVYVCMYTWSLCLVLWVAV